MSIVLSLAVNIICFYIVVGDIGAFMSVAHCYSHGKGVDVDYEKAFEYHNMAASKGVFFK